MARHRSASKSAKAAKAVARDGVAAKRIDAPHEHGDRDQAPPQTAGAESVADPVTPFSELRTQAHQLAEILRGRQIELDRREANLQASVARIEQEARESRLLLQARQRQLEDERTRIEQFAKGAAAAGSGRFARREGPHTEGVDPLASLLAEEHELLRQQRADLHATIEAHRRRIDRECETLAERRRQLDAEFQEQRRAIDAQMRQQRQHHLALDKNLEAVREAHRETLEMRMAIDAARTELAEVHDPDAVERAIDRSRRRISDRYREDRESLAVGRRELERWVDRLADHRDQLQRQQEAAADAFERREAELDARAAELDAREQGIEREEVRLQAHLARWHKQSVARRRA